MHNYSSLDENAHLSVEFVGQNYADFRSSYQVILSDPVK